MNKLLLTVFLSMVISVSIQAQNVKTQLTTTELTSLYQQQTRGWKSVHDPSVVWDAPSQTFYIYGSHYYGVKTKDFQTYTDIQQYYAGGYDSPQAYKAFQSHPSRQVKRVLPGGMAEETVTLASHDASAFASTYASIKVGDRESTSVSDWVSGCQWAPDIVYNPNLKKWCYYLSINGDYWASVIVLMTSDSPEGPFKYEAPIVFGGFDGQSRSGRSVDFRETDLQLVLGNLPSLPTRYQTSKWGDFYPNCIDPCAFFDEEGELWLAYGSWSGGIYMLRLDKNTGLRDYTYTYQNTGNPATNTPVTSDAYFGQKIAGGRYVSGEGPYIQHIGQYYYLFMSNGGFAPDGGYDMRVFRSERPDGPYTDASGQSAIYSSYQLNYGINATTSTGMRLMGAMNHWGLMTVGECAQGHNSACQDDMGRTFLVCHTKFNDGTLRHQMRAYQLYLNQPGWLCSAPFQFNGETVTDKTLASSQPYSHEEVQGYYHVMIHPAKLDHSSMQETTPAVIHLSSDGKVTGAYTGTWKYQEEGKSYLQIILASTSYDGVIVEQTLEGSTAKALCFTAVCTSGTHCGEPCWGYKLQPPYALSYNYQKASADYFRSSLYRSISSNKEILFSPEENVSLIWNSSNPDVFSNTGKYTAPSENTPFTLTARLESSHYYWEQTYQATALAPSSEIPGDQTTGLLAYYNFDEKPAYNMLNEEQFVSYGHLGTSTQDPSLETDHARFGQVVHQYAGAKDNNSLSRMPNPLFGETHLQGFTVSLWVKRLDDTDDYNALWGFFNSRSVTAEGARLYLTGNSYIGFNDNQGNWFDINHPNTKRINKIKKDKWHLATLTFSKETGCTFYLDGVKYLTSQMNHTGSADESTFNRDLVLDFVSTAKYFYLGAGSFWGSAEALFDDLMIYNRPLSADDVKGLHTMLNRVNSFNDGTIVGVHDLTLPTQSSPISMQGMFDLMGRPVAQPSKGLYIVNGRKVLFK